MLFTEVQRGEILILLGYGVSPSSQLQLLINHLSEPFPDYIVQRVQTLVQDATEIDEQLNVARADSMALEIDTLKIDYMAHVRHLKSEGSRLLRQLEALVGIELNFDRYSGTSPRTNHSSTSVVSYW
jgi:hypothetical protein